MQVPESEQGQLWKALEDHQQLVRSVRLGCQDLRKIQFAVAEQRKLKARDMGSWNPSKGVGDFASESCKGDLALLEHSLVTVMAELGEDQSKEEQREASKGDEGSVDNSADNGSRSFLPTLETLLLAAAEAARTGFDSSRGTAEDSPSMALLGEEITVGLDEEDYELIFHDKELGIVLRSADGGLPRVKKCERPMPRLGDVAIGVNGMELRGHPEPLKRILAVARSPRRPITLRFAPPSFLERSNFAGKDEMENGTLLLEGPVALISLNGSDPKIPKSKSWGRLCVGNLSKAKGKQLWVRVYSAREPGSRIVTSQVITNMVPHARDLAEKQLYVLCFVPARQGPSTASLKPFTIGFQNHHERDAWYSGMKMSGAMDP